LNLPTITKPRLLVALLGAGAALVLGGCIAFTGPITLSQQDVIGKVRVSFTVCATNHPDGPGGVTDHPGCDEPSNNTDDTETPGEYQVLLGFRVPAGTIPPASFSSGSGEPLAFTRSSSYEQQLQSRLPAGAGEAWVGYVSNVYSYTAGADGDPAKKASFAVDFGLPPGSGGKPFPGPFTIRPVVGGREAGGAPGDTTDPARPVSCGDDIFGGGGAPFSGGTNCIDSPDESGTANHLEVATRDLALGGTQVAGGPGKRVNVPFTARYAGAANPGGRFTLTASTNLPNATASPSTGTLVPGANSSTPVQVGIDIPRRARAGLHVVVLAATLPNGQQRLGSTTLRVRDGIPPVARGLAIRPNAFTPFPDTSSIAARKGARVSYRLTEAATVRFRVQRRVCKRGKCRYRLLKGSFRHNGTRGTNRFRFTGFVRNRKLRPGRYRLVGVPVDASKNKGRQVRARFRITKR
jgi:hypothetical protein